MTVWGDLIGYSFAMYMRMPARRGPATTGRAGEWVSGSGFGAEAIYELLSFCGAEFSQESIIKCH